MDKSNIGLNKETVQTDKTRIKIRSFYRAVQAGCLPDVYIITVHWLIALITFAYGIYPNHISFQMPDLEIPQSFLPPHSATSEST